MHILIGLALAAGLLATGTAHAQWNVERTPLGGGFYSNQATGPDGRTATGTTTPLGGGFSSTTWTDSRGHSSTCTTTPLGGGFSSTNCQ